MTVFIVIPIILFIFSQIATRYWQDVFIFRPKWLPKNFQFNINFPYEEIYLPASDGGEINGLLFKYQQPKGLILYFHGNAGSLERWGKLMEELLPLGWDILIFDYRGYGKSSGRRDEKLMLDDTLLMYKWANNHYKKEDIIIYGRSLGTAMATYLASEVQPPKLILETPFYSMADLFYTYYPFMPHLFSFKYSFRNDLYIQKVKCPILIFHGTDDKIVPYSQGRKLFNLAINSAQIITFAGGSHNNCMTYPTFWQALRAFLD